MSGPNVPAFIPVMSTRASAPLPPIAEETSSADNAKNPIQLLVLNVALNQVTNTCHISIITSTIAFHSNFRGISGEWAGWQLSTQILASKRCRPATAAHRIITCPSSFR